LRKKREEYNMKKVSLLLAIVLLFSFATAAGATTSTGMVYENFKCEYVYEGYSKGTVVIVGLSNKNVTSLTVPGSIAGAEVQIGSYAFEKLPYLKTVTVQDGVTKIGEGAFYDCASLATVYIPESVKVVGKNAFEGCESLTYAPIPENTVLEIEEKAEETTDEAPAQTDSNSLVPLKFVAEKGNLELSWNAETREVTIKGLRNEVVIKFGENFINDKNQGEATGDKVIYKNGEAVETKEASVIIDAVTYVPKEVIAAVLENDLATDMIFGMGLTLNEK
jgi:hypothetical protein